VATDLISFSISAAAVANGLSLRAQGKTLLRSAQEKFQAKSDQPKVAVIAHLLPGS
jgi:hypothetical protein